MVSEKLSSKRRDYELLLCFERKNKQALSEFFNEMNVIARGVEARFDSLIGRSKIVTQGATDIGRQLDIPEKEIQRWAAMKLMHDAERNGVIKPHH